MSTAVAQAPTYKRYRCRVETKPDAHFSYASYVWFWSNSDDYNDLFIQALGELNRVAYRVRNPLMWQMSSYSEI